MAKNKAKNDWKRSQQEENANYNKKQAADESANSQPFSFLTSLEQAPSVGQITKIIENQFKKDARNSLTEEELDALSKGIVNVIHSLQEKMNKSELNKKGAWQADGSIWKKVSDLVGKEAFVKAFPIFEKNG